jgi:translation initiation factor IF-1
MKSSLKEKKELIEMYGVVAKTLTNGGFLVDLGNGSVIVAHVAGKIRRNRIRVLLGDRVLVELSIYDLTKGRIIYRFKPVTPVRAR